MSERHKWIFKARFRRNIYGWEGTALASKRLREAVSEIRKVARKDPVTAADGVVALFERLWPALEGIDSSSGGSGMAVDRTIEALIPILIDAPAEIATRRRWLECLYQAVCDDGVEFLAPVESRWGEICVFPELVEYWIDFLLPGLTCRMKEGGRGGLLHRRIYLPFMFAGSRALRRVGGSTVAARIPLLAVRPVLGGGAPAHGPD